MNIATIEMPKTEAIEAYREYRDAVKSNPNTEDRQIMLGYRALAKGQAIINLYDALRVGGLNEQGHPKLAVARADWQAVRFDERGRRGGQSSFRESDLRGLYCECRIDIPRTVFTDTKYLRSFAMVPLIPPRLRPANLADYCILWEATWQPVSPGDPLLLKHLAGPLYAVLAVWDLTELERAVMGQRVLR